MVPRFDCSVLVKPSLDVAKANIVVLGLVFPMLSEPLAGATYVSLILTMAEGL